MNRANQVEYGHRGQRALVERYGPAQVDAWRRLGGRPRNRTFDEIMAGVDVRRRTKADRVSPRAGGRTPATTSGRRS